MAREDKVYTDWLHTLACAACGARPVQVHHPRHNVGGAMRAHDHRGVPMCPACHESLHRLTFGHFKGWVRQQVRDWCDQVGERCRGAYLDPSRENVVF